MARILLQRTSLSGLNEPVSSKSATSKLASGEKVHAERLKGDCERGWNHGYPGQPFISPGSPSPDPRPQNGWLGRRLALLGRSHRPALPGLTDRSFAESQSARTTRK